ncbi:MAG TPA: PxKF domain-containing protein [Gemmatimonadaceae bacterium]|nr:PxKF domain-containing protein [Gemmatimonadaceae bacterium]
MILLTLATSLGACTDEPPTAVPHRPDIISQFALVNGPVTPISGGIVSSPVVTIANSAVREMKPRISGDGDLLCYDEDPFGSAPTTRYYRFSSAVSSTIPGSGEDRDCAADGNRVTFSRLFPAAGRSGIMLFDVSTSTLSELDPQPSVVDRRLSAIAGNTVLFLQSGRSQVRVIDLAAPNQSQLLSSTASPQNYGTPNLSPDGNVAVWDRCDAPFFPTNCDVMKAVRTAGTWGTPQLVTSSPDNEGSSDTDGSYIVWTSDLNNSTESDIYIQSVAGGPVTQLAIPGPEYSTSISGGVVTFQGPNAGGGSYEVFAYIIATNKLYQITNTPPNEILSDVAVLGNGDIRIVWDASASGNSDVYATTFTPPFSFGGFSAPVDNLPTINVAKAGAGIPVKFSLGGDRGLTIFASGSPSSVTVTCNAGAPTGTVEETATAGNSGLSYDATSDTYSYIWKTEKAWVNTCRRLTLQFVDGTVANADFQFTK